MPTASIARTWKVCAPPVSAAVVNGELQLANGAASTRHSKRDPGSVAENANVGVGTFVRPSGPPASAVSGGVVSTVSARTAGEASTFVAGSVARTSNVCAPSARANVAGELHAANAAPSTRHSNVEPASVAVNANVGVVVFVGPTGPLVIAVSGAIVSTVKVVLAGSGSTLPKSSIAWTANVCVPSLRTSVANGDAHGENDAVSVRHSNAAPGSEVNANVGVATFVGSLGPLVSIVSGGITSCSSTQIAATVARRVAAPVLRTRLVQPLSIGTPRSSPGSVVRICTSVGVSTLNPPPVTFLPAAHAALMLVVSPDATDDGLTCRS